MDRDLEDLLYRLAGSSWRDNTDGSFSFYVTLDLTNESVETNDIIRSLHIRGFPEILYKK